MKAIDTDTSTTELLVLSKEIRHGIAVKAIIVLSARENLH